MKYSYYPGCSLHGSSREYDASTQAVCTHMGVELEELPDWICCGASSGHSLNQTLNVGLPARNLMIAEEAGMDIAVPCAACYNRLKTAAHAIREDKAVREQMKELLGHDFGDRVKVLNLVELILERIGTDAIRSRVVKPLAGLKVACYYGCLLVRPAEVTRFDDPEHPRSLDDVMRAVGAEPLYWSYKTECCGGSHALTRADIVTSLVDEIIKMAREAGADAIVTACPLCMGNLDTRQGADPMPVVFFTELLGLAFGIEDTKRWLSRHVTDPMPLLQSLGLLP